MRVTYTLPCPSGIASSVAETRSTDVEGRHTGRQTGFGRFEAMDKEGNKIPRGGYVYQDLPIPLR